MGSTGCRFHSPTALFRQRARLAWSRQRLCRPSQLVLVAAGTSARVEARCLPVGPPPSATQIPAERNSSEEALAAQVDSLVRAHLLQVSQQMLGLQAALASAGGVGRWPPGQRAAPAARAAAIEATLSCRQCSRRAR